MAELGDRDEAPRPTTQPARPRRPTIFTLLPKKEWKPDAPKCELCEASFTLFNRRHHCRACGACVCDRCSLTRMNFFKSPPQRVCDRCCQTVKAGDLEKQAPLRAPSADDELAAGGAGGAGPGAGPGAAPGGGGAARTAADSVDGGRQFRGGRPQSRRYPSGDQARGGEGKAAGEAEDEVDEELARQLREEKLKQQQSEFERAWQAQQERDAQLDEESRQWRQRRAQEGLPDDVMQWDIPAVDIWLADVACLPPDVVALFKEQLTGPDLLQSLDDEFLHSGALDSLEGSDAKADMVSEKLALLRRQHKEFLSGPHTIQSD